MTSHRWAFIFEAPETDPVDDRVVIDRGGIRTVLVPVASASEAAKAAVGLVDDGIQFIELCGGFGPVGAAKVIEAVGDRVAVGLVTFGAESLGKIAAVFRLTGGRQAGGRLKSSPHIDGEFQMETVIPGLHASAPESLPFAPSLEIRAFLLERDRGNLLIYSNGAVAAEAEAIESLGGISRHYLNHRHEAAFGCDRIAAAVGAPLHCHENEQRSVSNKCSVGATFSERHRLDNDFEVIPTPGHTSGATAYLWNNDRHRCLFTGDSIYFGDDGWVAAVLGSSDRDAYIASLELIRELDFDVLAPWAAPSGQPFHSLTDKASTQRRIDAILDRVRAGQNH